MFRALSCTSSCIYRYEYCELTHLCDVARNMSTKELRIINSTQQSASLEAESFASGQKILWIFWNPYLLTPWCRVLLEKLTGLQLVKKFPAFYGTRRFIIALTSVRHLSLSWTSPIQSTYPHPTSWISILILSTHLCLGLPSGLFPSGFPTKTLYTPSPHPYAPHAQPISFFSILFSWNPTFHYVFHNSPPFLPTLSYTNQQHRPDKVRTNNRLITYV